MALTAGTPTANAAASIVVLPTLSTLGNAEGRGS